MADAVVSPRRNAVTALQPTGDAFDRDDFNPVVYINKMFPTEQTLAGLDPLIATLKRRISKVDAEILTAVRQQSSSGHRARQDLDNAKAEIQELFGKITEIRRKAEQSEYMVEEICRDIKKLDYAKRHLTSSITALRRLSMLDNAVGQLQRSVERHEYAEAAQLLEAVQQLFAHFQAFVNVPKVADIGQRLGALQSSLQHNAMREFELLGVGDDTPNMLLLERLRSCCLVVDALGPQARDELVDSVCKKEMGVYAQIFHSEGETSHLERTERRFAWFRKRFKSREEVWNIFPPSWKVPPLLASTFCQLTKTQLAEILDTRNHEIAENVEGLLIAVKATNDFEQELDKRFGTGSKGQSDDGDDGQKDDWSSASQLQRKAQDNMHGANRVNLAESTAAIRGSPAHKTLTHQQFVGSISSVFQSHLSLYVAAEEKQLMSTLEGLMKEEVWRPTDDNARSGVLKSSSDLFAVVKKSLMRCSMFVTRGQAMLDLCRAFQRVITAYGAQLKARIPRPSNGNLSAVATAPAGVLSGSPDWHVRLAEGDEGVICSIVRTCEYCQDLVGQLGRSVSKQLADDALREQVDVSDVEDMFSGLVTECLAALVLGTETNIDAALIAMTRANWGAVESVGDHSEFANTIRRVLTDTGTTLGQQLSELHYEFFCEKLAASFTPRYYDCILRCRRMSEAGSRQLLLDTQVIKSMLLELPSKGQPNSGATASYVAYVNKEIVRSEALLKVLGSRPEVVVDSFVALMPNGNANDFAKILDLKALKKQEAQQLMDAFTRRTGRTSASRKASAVTSTLTPSFPGAAAGVLSLARGSMGPAGGVSVPQLASLGSLTGGSAAAGQTAQEIAARFRQGTAGATARASTGVRETMNAMKQMGQRLREASTTFRRESGMGVGGIG